MHDKLYTCLEISDLLGISIKAVYNKIASLHIKCVKYKDRHSLYAYNDVLKMKSKQRTIPIDKYYPMKTIETYYIFQSKLNTL